MERFEAKGVDRRVLAVGRHEDRVAAVHLRQLDAHSDRRQVLVDTFTGEREKQVADYEESSARRGI